MKESRLFKIVYILLDNGKVTASELADKLEVSTRTIYRDLDSLSNAGIPIYTEDGRNGGIFLKEDFTLDKAVVSREEKDKIIGILKGFSKLDNNEELLSKLQALFNSKEESYLEVDFSNWEESSDNGYFQEIKEAILDKRKIEIHYINLKGIESYRLVYPLKLIYKGSYWYLRAYCTYREEIRYFKLNRIINLVVLDEMFIEKIEDSYIAGINNIDVIDIVIKANKDMGFRIYDEFYRGNIKRLDDDSLLIEGKIKNDIWLIDYLLSFGSRIEVLEPTWLREDLIEEYEKIVELYEL